YDDGANTFPVGVIFDVVHHTDQVIDTILIGDDPDIAEHGRRVTPQFRAGLDAAQLLPVGNAIDGGDALGISAAPPARDITIGVIGRDHAVGDLEGAFLREQQKFVEEV